MLVCLFAVSAVSAADNITQDVVGVEETTSEVVIVEENNLVINSMDGGNNILSASPNGTFTDLANEITNANGTLYLTKNYVYSSDDLKYANGIIIDKELTINGKGFTINGNNQARTFQIAASDVVLNNITFKNNLIDGKSGGAVLWGGANGVLSDCSFLDCSANFGGAIYWSGVNGVLSDSSFVNCSVSEKSGGAIYWSGVNGVLSDSSFVNCVAGYGGAVYIDSKGSDDVLSNCSFMNCSATYSTAVHLNCANAVLSNCSFMNAGIQFSSNGIDSALSGCTFVNGGILWYGANGTLSNCSFKGGSNRWSGADGKLYDCTFVNCSSYDAGAILWTSVCGALYDCSFIDCSASRDGGAIHWDGADGKLYNCSFVNSNAGRYGGAVLWGGANGVLFDCSFVNSSITHKWLDAFGGAVYWSGADGKLYDCSIVNSSDSAIHWSGIRGALYGCSFVNCHADESGGAVYWTHDNGKLYNCSFVNSHAEYGGAVLWDGFNGILYNNSFVNSHAGEYGGAVYWGSANGALSNCSFVNSHAGEYGGAVYWGSANGALSNCSFLDCNAGPASGMVALGGAVYWAGANGALSNCSFVNCTSLKSKLGGCGGAVYWAGANGVLSDSSFIDCFVKYGDSAGGAVYSNSANGIISGCIFVDCAAVNGGAVYINSEHYERDDEDDLVSYYTNDSIVNCWFVDSAAANGGAVYWENSNGNLYGCNFVSCSASGSSYDGTGFGGAVYAGGLSIIVDETSFYNCHANSYGGGIFSNCINCCLINSFFEANVASRGSDWYSAKPINITETKESTIISAPNTIVTLNVSKNMTVTLRDGNDNFLDGQQITLFNNMKILTTNSNGQVSFAIPDNLNLGNYSAIISYGGNDVYKRSITIADVYVRNEGYVAKFADLANLIDKSFIQLDLDRNYSFAEDDSSYINGIAINKSIVINGNGVTINGNKQTKILRILSSNVTLSNISFVNSVSEDNGSAVYWSGADGVLSDCSFVDCAGAVYWSGADGVLSDCSFVGCVAENGGAVYWFGADGVLSDCCFVDCTALNGGAVLWVGAHSKLFKCSFINCLAMYENGGAVLWHGDYGTVAKSSFINCTADVYGGGIYFDGANCSLINPIFEGCIASEGPDWYSVYPLNFINETSIETVLAASDVTTTYMGSKNLVAVLKDVDGDLLVGEQISIALNNVEYALQTDSNGEASLAIPSNLAPKTYVATISYAGNEIYESSTATANVVVNKADTVISASDVSVVYKDPKGELVTTIISEHGKPLVVNLNINLNGKDYTVRTDSNGQASIAIDTLKAGTYTATISYKGSGNYKASTATAKVTVTKAGTVISAQDVNVAYKDPNGELVATIVNEHGKSLVVNLNVELNGKTYTAKTDSNGQMSLAIDTLTPGTYTATISYKGSSNYKATSTTAKVTVTKADTIITASDVNVAYKDPNGELVANIINEHGKTLVVTLNVELNGKTYAVKTDSNGQAVLPLDTLTPGTYNAKISYKGSSNYKASSATVLVTVTKANTIISASDVNIAYKDPNGELVATVINEHGKPLVVNLNVELNGKTYTVRTDSNGQAILPLDTLTPGSYNAKISYKGSSNYKASSATVLVTVTKANTIISASDVNIAYKDPNGELVATIVNEHGKSLVVTLSININGKTYNVKTDSNGQASLAIDTLTPGTYTATISYKGSSNYNAATTTAKVTVTKAATIISAPDVSVKYKDPNGKLVSTITNEHGKPLVVNLNVDLNGKTYTVKTDSNGQASVSTSDLAPGSYTAAISYKGSGNYKAASTTAKITVKS